MILVFVLVADSSLMDIFGSVKQRVLFLSNSAIYQLH